MRHIFLFCQAMILVPVFAATPKDLPAGEWSSIQAAVRQHRQTVVPVAGGWRAYNVAQQLSALFDGRGFELRPDQGNWRWGLQLERYGYAGQLRGVTQAKAVAEGQHFSYQWDSTMQEWFINGAGTKQELEHGYTLAARPGEGNGLQLYLKVRGGLTPGVSQDRKSVAFFESGTKRAALHYGGLKVIDATGRELASRFSAQDGGLRLEVDDAAATYPVVIDPVVYNSYLKATNLGAGDTFGGSAAISGNIIAIGAPREAGNGKSPADDSMANAGAVYVFRRLTSCKPDGTCALAWMMVQYIKSPNPRAGAAFGYDVALSGDTLVVGEPGAASASVFKSSGTGLFARFNLFTDLRPPAFEPSSHFGWSVAVSGETIVVGAPSNSSSSGVGAVFVFTMPAGSYTWSTRDRLPAPALQNFGHAVGVSGTTIVVTSQGFGGPAYIYTGSPGAWALEAAVGPDQPEPGEDFGQSVDVDGDTVVVGAPGFTGKDPNGSVYVITRKRHFYNGCCFWGVDQKLKPTVGISHTFGHSVAISGSHLVVGSAFESGDGRNPPVTYDWVDSGAAWVFTRTTGAKVNGFVHHAYLKAPNTDKGDSFGLSNTVAISGNTIVVGAPQEDGNGNSLSDNSLGESGAAYTFEIVPVNVTFDAPGAKGNRGSITTVGNGCAPGTYLLPRTLPWTTGALCKFTFAPGAGQTFVSWEDLSTANPRQLVAPNTNTAYTPNVIYRLPFGF